MTDSRSKVQTLTLTQFTAFAETTFDFCPGINVLIGANATGKTHVMKLIYALLKAGNMVHGENNRAIDETIYSKLQDVFQSRQIGDLIRQSDPSERAMVRLSYSNHPVEFSITPSSLLSLWPESIIPQPASVMYLPAQEFLSINEGFIAIYQKRELPYDETFYDLGLALNAPPLRRNMLTGEVQEVIDLLREIIAGAGKREVVTQQNGRFHFDLPEGSLDVHLVAEGYRKIATLLYLLRNGSLTEDGILFWDEPEAQLNPRLVVKVVEVLQKLASIGVQVFVSTHDYLLSHELSLLAEYPAQTEVELKFFALHKPNRKAGVQVESGRSLAEIEHNPILAEFAAHYDRELALFQAAPISE